MVTRLSIGYEGAMIARFRCQSRGHRQGFSTGAFRHNLTPGAPFKVLVVPKYGYFQPFTGSPADRQLWLKRPIFGLLRTGTGKTANVLDKKSAPSGWGGLFRQGGPVCRRIVVHHQKMAEIKGFSPTSAVFLINPSWALRQTQWQQA
jgi:hypothetical protein